RKMSDLAITEIGQEENTAWFYRTEFLNYGTIFNHFYCPFCYIPLKDYNISKEGKVVQSPHFRCFTDQPHLNGCDGTPLSTTNKDSNKKPKSQFEPTTMQSYPEALVDRRPPIQPRPLTQPNITSRTPTAEEIQAKRKKIGNKGRNIPTSSLLKPFIDARNSLMHDAYTKFPDPKERSPWIKSALLNMPLRLDDQTTYQDAFRKPHFIDFRGRRRIYHSSGKITLQHDKFIIQGVEFFKNDQLNVELVIDPSLVNQDSPQAHKKLLDQLQELAESETILVDWYAFGKATKNNEERNFHLEIDNFDHIFLKKKYIKHH
ncbi:hypothetical protein ACUDJH_002920, partial [Acinetobacter baumannii]